MTIQSFMRPHMVNFSRDTEYTSDKQLEKNRQRKINTERIAFWEQPQNRGPIDGSHDLVDSLPYPFLNYVGMFKNRDVLEIGPGRGRQYDYLKESTRFYSIADISNEILSEECFDLIGTKILITDYKQEATTQFDVVHFWYVLHHVREEEVEMFFDFIYRHLHENGLVLFNTPQLQNDREIYLGDGISTTYFSLPHILKVMEKNFRILVKKEINEKSTGHLIIGEKIGV